MANVIERNLSYLCLKTVGLKEICIHLISSRVITPTQSEEIESCVTNLDKCKKLYMIISRKLSNKATYEHLTQALYATNQHSVVEKLNSSQAKFEQLEFFKKLKVPAKALLIVDVAETNFKINTDAFNFVLDQTGDMPIVVLSINGPTRSGKSFLLNYFLRYLEKQGGGSGVGSEELFKWGGGQHRVTVGINLWSKPFFVQTDDGTIVAVLLLDVQGLFDKETTYRQNAIIFALSSLFSNYMMYNQQGLIREDVLQNIQCFLNLSDNVGKEYNTDITKELLHLPSNILLLLRDLEEENYDYGLHTFGAKPPSSPENYLLDLFKPSEGRTEDHLQPGENQRVRNKLRDLPGCNIASYLLPHPGLQFVKNKTATPIQTFEEEAQHFVRFIINSQLRLTRTSQHEIVTRTQYASILEGIAAVCHRSPKYFLRAKSVEELKNINEHMSALQSGRKVYYKLLSRFLGMYPDGTSEEKLSSANGTALKAVEKEFLHLENYKTDYEVQFLEDKDKMIAELYADAKKQNEQNIRDKKMRDEEEMYKKALAAAELEKKKKEAELIAAQISHQNAEAAALKDKETREAEHQAKLEKLQEEAQRARLKIEQELHRANLDLTESQRLLNNAKKRYAKRNFFQRTFF